MIAHTGPRAIAALTALAAWQDSALAQAMHGWSRADRVALYRRRRAEQLACGVDLQARCAWYWR